MNQKMQYMKPLTEVIALNSCDKLMQSGVPASKRGKGFQPPGDIDPFA